MFSFTVCVYVYRCMCVWLVYRKQQKNKRIKNEKVAKVNIVYVPSSPNMFAVHLVAVLLRSVSPLYQLLPLLVVKLLLEEFFSFFYSILHVTFFYKTLLSCAFPFFCCFFVWLAGGSASFKSSLLFFFSHVTKVKVLYRKCTILCSSKNCACMASTSQCSIQFASSLVNRWMDW